MLSRKITKKLVQRSWLLMRTHFNRIVVETMVKLDYITQLLYYRQPDLPSLLYIYRMKSSLMELVNFCSTEICELFPNRCVAVLISNIHNITSFKLDDRCVAARHMLTFAITVAASLRTFDFPIYNQHWMRIFSSVT